MELPQLDPNMTADAAYQAFTEVNTLWTFCDPMINIGIASLSQESQARGYERSARTAASPEPFFGDWVDAGGERFQLWLGMMEKHVSRVMNDLSMSPHDTIERKSFSFKETLLYSGTITLTLQDDSSLRMTGAAGTRTLVKKHREE